MNNRHEDAPRTFRIVQVAAMTVPGDEFNANIAQVFIYGVGDDGVLYGWDSDCQHWVPFAMEVANG